MMKFKGWRFIQDSTYWLKFELSVVTAKARAADRNKVTLSRFNKFHTRIQSVYMGSIEDINSFYPH